DSDPGLLDRAIEDLRAVVTAKDTDGTPIETSSNPVHVLVQRELGACLLRKGLHDEAAARFRRIVEIGAPPQLVADAHYSLGKVHLLEKDVSAAVAAFQRSVRALPADDPRRFNVLIEISDVHSNLEDDAEAAWRVLEDAEAENPPEEVRVGILLRMAQILDRLGEIESCVDKLNQALAIDPHAAPVLVTMAEIETNLEHFDAAERYYQAVLERDRGHRQAREGLRLLEARRRMGSGAGDSEPADVMRALVSRAAKHRRKGELLAARDVYGQLLGIARQFGEEEPEVVAYCGIGETEEGLGRYGHAKRALEAAERLRPRRAETLLRLAAFHQRRTAEKKIARDHYLRYFEALEPGEKPIPEAHLNLGYVHADLKEWNESFDAFQRYLESGAGDAKAREEVEAFLNDGVIPHLIDQ
ncbi:MAG: tetratricopeptide repeat protein, partial [Planctomycetota bacterium]|nr:tetratricopeptide repeat protein [Planctomycetota bacterium]